MRLVQFFKWLWINNDPFNRTLGCFGLFWALPCAISAIWITAEIAFLSVTIGMGVVTTGWVLYGLFSYIRKLWTDFNDACPPEDIQVIRKLKGIPTPSGE